jgi:hypothetical protein
MLINIISSNYPMILYPDHIIIAGAGGAGGGY